MWNRFQGSEVQTETVANALEAECYSKASSAAFISSFLISITSLICRAGDGDRTRDVHRLGFLFSPTEFETQAEVSFVHAVASIIANRQRFHECTVIDVLACVRNRVVRRIRDVERFDTEL